MNNQLTLFDRDSDYLESSVSEFENRTASFRVHASLIYKLGESLIADEVTALSELIKNSYDADATICSLVISSDYIEEINGKDSFTTEKEVLKNEFCICAGKFGRINEMMKLTPAKRKKAMIEYEEELLLAEKLFKVY